MAVVRMNCKPYLMQEAADAQHQRLADARGVQPLDEARRHAPQRTAEEAHGVHRLLAAQHVDVAAGRHALHHNVACIQRETNPVDLRL